MKKIMAWGMAVLLAAGLAGCGGKKPVDGTYTARVDAATAQSAQGWTDTLTITYRDGAIADVDFDSFDEEGRRKSSLSAEEYPMDPAPKDWMARLEENIKLTDKPQKVAAVAGATQSSGYARRLYEAIQNAAKEGKTDPLTVTVKN